MNLIFEFDCFPLGATNGILLVGPESRQESHRFLYTSKSDVLSVDCGKTVSVWVSWTTFYETPFIQGLLIVHASGISLVVIRSLVLEKRIAIDSYFAHSGCI